MTLLGIDVGGTAVKLSQVDESAKILRRAEHSVNFDAYRTPILRTVLDETAAFLRMCDIRPVGIGISSTGQIDAQRGIVAGTCGSLPDWIGVDLKNAFERAFDLPTVVMNDANCALLGECWIGRAQGLRDVVMVTLGTGVGGGVYCGGMLLGGRDGFAGEIGHFPLRVGGRRCTCGNYGCYEQYASVTALIRHAGTVLPSPLTGRKIFALAQSGESAALASLDRWIDDIATGLTGLTHLFNPQMLLVGGGVSAQTELLIAPLRQRVLAACMPRYRDGLEVEAAALHNDAGMFGAVRAWLNANG